MANELEVKISIAVVQWLSEVSVDSQQFYNSSTGVIRGEEKVASSPVPQTFINQSSCSLVYFTGQTCM